MKIKYKNMTTGEKMRAVMDVHPDEWQNVLAGSQFFGDDICWDLAYDALQQGKKVIFEPGNPDHIGEMTYRYE